MTSRTIVSEFGRPRVFLPVVHPSRADSALEAVRVAVEAGADGVWVINQGMTADGVLSLARRIGERFPGLWLGVNLLGHDPHAVLAQVRGLPVRGVWVDNAASVTLDDATRDDPARPLLFGGVAFKYQVAVAPEHFPAHTQDAMRRGVDVVTTSGEATGSAAHLDKVLALHAALAGRPLALASGVTPANVGDYVRHVDAFLVASGIESSFGVLDPDRTRQLAAMIHAAT